MVSENIQCFSFSVKLISLRIGTESPSVLCEENFLLFINEHMYICVCTYVLHIYIIYMYI